MKTIDIKSLLIGLLLGLCLVLGMGQRFIPTATEPPSDVRTATEPPSGGGYFIPPQPTPKYPNPLLVDISPKVGKYMLSIAVSENYVIGGKIDTSTGRVLYHRYPIHKIGTVRKEYIPQYPTENKNP